MSLEFQNHFMKESSTGVINQGACLRCYPTFFISYLCSSVIISTYVSGTTFMAKRLIFNDKIICGFSKSIKVN